MKESIKNILKFGGKVSIDYKSKFKDWYGKIEILELDGIYIISGSCTYRQINDIDIAINYFLELCFSSKNIAFIYKRLLNKKLICELDFEESIPNKVRELFKSEGILADKELEDMGVYKTIFPKKEDAKLDFENIKNINNIDNLWQSVKSFNDKYISIDSKIRIYAKFKYDNGIDKSHDYTVNLNEKEFNMNYINKLVDDNSVLSFKCISLLYEGENIDIK